MPNTLDGNGLQVKALADIVADLTTDLKAIYGSDINVDSNSPDGQMINIFAQAGVDLLELLVLVNAAFSPDSASGTLLDQRVALNGITRRAGTYTYTPVSITTDRALNLTGLDALDADPTAEVFTVQDDAGNQFYLVASQTIGAGGTNSYSFRAVNVGKVQTTQNTITNQTTPVLGVTAVNNPLAATTTGIDEETDAQLRIRRAKSFFLAATSPADAIRAVLLEDVDGVVDALVVENNTGVIDSNSVPAHSIWIIVDGGTDADVANAINSKRAPGPGMFGSVNYTVNRPNSQTIVITFDRPVDQNLYVRFGIIPRVQGETFDNTLIKSQLVDALTFYIGAPANIQDVLIAMATIAPDAILSDVGVSSDGSTYGAVAQTASPQKRFLLSTARISIT